MKTDIQRLRQVWYGMNDRCHNPKSLSYHKYGAKGISVCQEWRGTEGWHNFKQWALSNGYQVRLRVAGQNDCTIDRINPAQNYSPDNCRFVSWAEQSGNRSNNIVIEYEGKRYALRTLCTKMGIDYLRMYKRIVYSKMTFEQAIRENVNYRHCKIRCIETGKIYKSMRAASLALGKGVNYVQNRIKGYGSKDDFHFEIIA